jgi:hypothetical protein
LKRIALILAALAAIVGLGMYGAGSASALTHVHKTGTIAVGVGSGTLTLDYDTDGTHVSNLTHTVTSNSAAHLYVVDSSLFNFGSNTLNQIVSPNSITYGAGQTSPTTTRSAVFNARAQTNLTHSSLQMEVYQTHSGHLYHGTLIWDYYGGNWVIIIPDPA